jgi:hypothetical protein
VRRKPVPDRLHLAMHGRIIEAPAHVGAAGDHLPVAHDHGTERIICLARLLDRHAHEALVIRRRRCRRGKTHGCAARDADCHTRKSGDEVPPIRLMNHAGMLQVRHLAIYRAA